jgi:hypothetical protein
MQEKLIMTPKHSLGSRKGDNLSFTGIGNSILRRTDYQVVSNKKVFSVSGGIGPARIGSDDWVKAKEKQERMQHFLRQLKINGDIPN